MAKIYDKRNYCLYYYSLLKTQHNLIFAFSNNDYNSRIIKIDLFFIGFAIDYAVNALFFNDETMHEIYINKDQFDLERQIPIIIYSYIISVLINSLLNFLALLNDAIINFKKNKFKKDISKRSKVLKSKLGNKFVVYYLINFFLLGALWYYISMFGIIYKNTQFHLLKDTLFSFCISFFYPFVYYLLPGCFRLPALSKNKNNRKYLYNFSKFLQMF